MVRVLITKISISREALENMQTFLLSDKAKFVEYALRIALIYLVQASWMVVFYFNLGGTGIPISLPSVGRKYVKSVWKENHYNGYQISPNYLLGDVSTTITPKGLNAIAKIGLVLLSYIASYKGVV